MKIHYCTFLLIFFCFGCKPLSSVPPEVDNPIEVVAQNYDFIKGLISSCEGYRVVSERTPFIEMGFVFRNDIPDTLFSTLIVSEFSFESQVDKDLMLWTNNTKSCMQVFFSTYLDSFFVMEVFQSDRLFSERNDVPDTGKSDVFLIKEEAGQYFVIAHRKIQYG